MIPWVRRTLALLLLAAALAVALHFRAPAQPLSSATTPGTPVAQVAESTPSALSTEPTASPGRTGGRGARRSGTPSVRRGDPPRVTPEAVSTEVTVPPLTTPEPSATAEPVSLPSFEDLIATVPARIGLVIEAPDGTTLLQHNADAVFQAASLYKLGIMVELFRQREAGELSFSDTVTLWPGYFIEDDPVYGWDDAETDVPIGELLRNMIVVSSNVAAEALLDRVGTDQVNATMAQLGLTQTQIRWYPDKGTNSAPTPFDLSSLPPGDSPDDPDVLNITSPQNMARLFQLMLQGQVVDPAASGDMLDLLAQQEINDRLPAGLPDGTVVAHKTGNLDDVVHDAGVIYAPRGPVVVAILSDQVDDEGQVDEFMQQVARAVYDAES